VNTKYLMMASSVFLGLIGVTCSFAPENILKYFSFENNALLVMIIQLLGALYIAFAFLNWTAKANLIGGIYSKPVSLGNTLHFVVGGVAMANYFLKHPDASILIIPVILYAVFAVLFALVLFGRFSLKKQF